MLHRQAGPSTVLGCGSSGHLSLSRREGEEKPTILPQEQASRGRRTGLQKEAGREVRLKSVVPGRKVGHQKDRGREDKKGRRGNKRRREERKRRKKKKYKRRKTGRGGPFPTAVSSFLFSFNTPTPHRGHSPESKPLGWKPPHRGVCAHTTCAHTHAHMACTHTVSGYSHIFVYTCIVCWHSCHSM